MAVCGLVLSTSGPSSEDPQRSLSSTNETPLPTGLSDEYLIGLTSVKNPEKAMAPHSGTLAWKIPWMEEPGRLQSMGSLRVKHD